MRPVEVVARAEGYLKRHGVESPRPTAEILLASTLGVDRAGLYARSDGLTAREAKLFGRALCSRCAGTPLQHLTGEQGFRRIMLAVRPGVFVPRPETEVVVDSALEVLDAISADRTPIVVDACTGSGAIALALKSERPGARIIATDVSAEAVALARENARRLDLEVDVVQGDLLDPLPPALRGAVDLVVANPPYVLPEEYASLPADVRADPRLALVGGIEVYQKLFRQAARWLRPEGVVVVEVSEMWSGRVVQAATDAGFGAERVLPDLADRDRVVTARRP
jgi:release factor glutamine methyltransferase